VFPYVVGTRFGWRLIVAADDAIPGMAFFYTGNPPRTEIHGPAQAGEGGAMDIAENMPDLKGSGN